MWRSNSRPLEHESNPLPTELLILIVKTQMLKILTFIVATSEQQVTKIKNRCYIKKILTSLNINKILKYNHNFVSNTSGITKTISFSFSLFEVSDWESLFARMQL